MKKCTSKTRNYYLISEDKDHFLPLDHEYSKDSGAVYYQQYSIKGADPQTFQILDKNYSLDNKAVYYHGKIILTADPNTFKVLNEVYAIDKDTVFVKNIRIEGADSKSFTLFEKNPERMDGIWSLWAHDDTYLYLNHQKVPIALDMAKFHYVTANIYTDDKKVLEKGEENSSVETIFKVREDITLPITRISTASFIDGKKRFFINTKQGTAKQTNKVDGNKIKVIDLTCSVKDYPYLKLNCETENKTYFDEVFFEDGEQVYMVYAEFTPFVSYLEPIFKKKANKTVYFFTIDRHSNLIHDGVLYSTIFNEEQIPRFVSTKIEGDLFGIFPANHSTLIADNGGFINLHKSAADDPSKLLRSFTKEDFGLLHFAKKQYKNAYVLENDHYFYILFKERTAQNIDSYIVDKKEKTVKEMWFNNDITEYSEALLKELGLNIKQ